MDKQSTPEAVLSGEELQVYTLLVQGMNVSEIAKYQSESHRRIADICARIKSRLNVATVAELKAIAAADDDGRV